MKYVRFGRSELEVSVIGLGLAALGRPGYITLGHGSDLEGDTTEAGLTMRSHRVLDAARDGGITYFDVARSYGKAEEFLAGWLTHHAGPSLVVGSKWGYTYTADWSVTADVHEVKTHDLETLERQLAESRHRLGTNLDVYQIHSATLETRVLEDRAVLDRLTDLRDRGLIIGLSTSGPRQRETIEKALEIRPGGVPLFGSVQATWNLLEQTAAPGLSAAADEGLAVIVKEALANGRLAGAEPGTTAPLGRVPGDHTPDALALAAALAQPWSTVVLSGAVTVGHLQSNLAALQVPAEAIAALPDVREPADTYWQRRSDLRWN